MKVKICSELVATGTHGSGDCCSWCICLVNSLLLVLITVGSAPDGAYCVFSRDHSTTTLRCKGSSKKLSYASLSNEANVPMSRLTCRLKSACLLLGRISLPPAVSFAHPHLHAFPACLPPPLSSSLVWPLGIFLLRFLLRRGTASRSWMQSRPRGHMHTTWSAWYTASTSTSSACRRTTVM